MLTPSLTITIRAETSLASSRQCRTGRLLQKCASQTRWPERVATFGRNLDAIGDHGIGLGGAVLELGGRFVAGEGVVDVGQVDDGDFGGVIATEEGGAFVQALSRKGANGRDEGHLDEAGADRLLVGLEDLAAVGEIIGVGRVVVDDDHVDAASWLQEGENGVVLARFATVDKAQF